MGVENSHVGEHVVQVGGNAGNVQVGGTHTHIHTTRAEVVWPVHVGDLPLAPGHYEDRADQVDLRTLLPRREPVTPAVTTVVLSGMGGVGKTQIAGAYARAAAEQHPPVDLRIWATATTADSIRATYARAAAKLGLTTPTTDPDEAAHLLLEWLSATTRTWLVILDDLTTPDHADGLWPPRTPTGRTLVTTRYRGADLNLAGHHTAHLEPFTPEQARHHLTTELAHHPHPCTHDDIDALTTDLGHLPLALGHATAYLHDQAITIQDYRHRLHNTPITHHPTNTRLAPIHTTLALSIPLAEHLAPGAATALLNIASLLDPNTIPDTVLTNHHIAEHLTTTPDRLHHGLRVLHRLNLLTHDPTTTTVRIHALVQRVVRETTTMTRAADPDGGTATLGRLAADALAEIWPEADTLTDIGTVLRANTTALAGHAEHHLFHPDTHPVLFRAGGSLGEQGLIAAARQHFHRLHEQTEAAHGPDHPDTLATRHNLARWRGEAGDSAGAVAAFEGLLTDALRVLGPGHPGTLATRHNLARWRGEAGDPAGAVAAYEGLLTDRLRVQGPDHPDTFATRHNLARWRGEAGDSAGAVAAFEGLLTDALRVLGPDHPGTLTTRHNLTRWRGEAGDPAGAVAAFEGLLADRLRVLGPDHPDTLATRDNLARWRGAAGDPAGAVTAFEGVLADRLRVLGPDHPDTLATRHNLAYWRGLAGDPAGAVAAFEGLLTDALRVLGPDHPTTLTTRHNLARWRSELDAN